MIKIDTNLINPIISNFTENVFKNKINYGKDTIQQPFPFYYQESMTYLNPSKPSNYNDVGFSNCCYNHNQELYNFDNAPFLMNILYTVCSHYNIFVEQIVEIRSFLQPPSKTSLEQEPHVDSEDLFRHNVPFYSLIYYASDSDGDTVFYNKGKEIKRVTPEKGKTVLFNGHLSHRGTKPVDKTKILLNFCFRGSPYNKLKLEL